MTVADPSLSGEYSAAVERVAGRVLEALAGGLGAFVPASPRPMAELAGVRVLGPDLFAPWLLSDELCDPSVMQTVAEARQAFPPVGPCTPGGQAASVPAWCDWATGLLLTRAGNPTTVPPPASLPEADRWQEWSVWMAQLASLALPGLDGPLHQAARREALALARGAVRAALRRDHRTAVRLARWLAWLEHAGTPCRVEAEPLLTHLGLVGDGSTRALLDLTIARRMLTESHR